MSLNDINNTMCSEEYTLIKVKSEPLEIPLQTDDTSSAKESNEFDCCDLGLGLEKLDDSEKTFDGIGEYYFESDHLALKGNTDYQNLLKIMALLQAQKIQAIKDIETLKESLAVARSDPVAFVNRLARKEDLNLPTPQPVTELPNIDWRKYAVNGKIPVFAKRYTTKDSSKVEAESSRRQMVRGRVYTETKPATFNQLWTSEEQQRLEELLIEHPPEEVESKRWQKIAAALGNRTTQQVASRVQKYFIKLMKAGFPVPGRMPSVTAIRKLHAGARRYPTRQLLHLSSFFKHRAPPVYMPETDDTSNCSFSSTDKPDPTSIEESSGENLTDQEDDLDEGLGNRPEYRELMYLKKLRQQKVGQGVIQHFGFKCDRCGVDPITGTRWHCTVCDFHSIDLCEECMDCAFEYAEHTPDHNMEPIYQIQGSKPYLDRDYMHFMGGDYNYLDPNYMPSL